MKLYILNLDHSVKEIDNPHDWLEWMSKLSNRRILQTDCVDQKIISTVFIGMDAQLFNSGTPLLFETMVFPDRHLSCRCGSYEEALRQHESFVKLCQGEEKRGSLA